MKIYMMKFAIRFFQVMEHIKKCYWQKKWQLFNRRVMMNRVVTIQRHFRTYLSNIFYNKNQKNNPILNYLTAEKFLSKIYIYPTLFWHLE